MPMDLFSLNQSKPTHRKVKKIRPNPTPPTCRWTESMKIFVLHPLISIRQYLSYDDCLEDKRENYQNCSVLYYVTQLCTIICTPTWAVLNMCFLCLHYSRLISVRVSYFVFGFSSLSLPVQSIVWKDASPKWPLCVECALKLYSLTHTSTLFRLLYTGTILKVLHALIYRWNYWS